DRTAIFQQDGAELPQQRHRDRLGTHHPFHRTLQECQQPGGGALSKMTIDRLFVHAHSQAARKAGQRTGTSLRLLPPAQNQQPGQLRKAHRALAQSCLFGQFDGIVFKQGGQGSTHAWYTRHCSAPVRRKRDDCFTSIFSQMLFFVCWLTNSTILNLTLMGPVLSRLSSARIAKEGSF